MGSRINESHNIGYKVGDFVCDEGYRSKKVPAGLVINVGKEDGNNFHVGHTIAKRNIQILLLLFALDL